MKRRTLLSTIVALVVIAVTPAVASAGGGCHTAATKSDASGQEEATVRMTDACFAATVTTVDPGAPVTFVNSDDGITHNVGGSQWGHFEDMYPGDVFTVSFDEKGIYPFACSYHAGMSGAIVVGDGTGAGAAGDTITVEPLAPAPAAVTRVQVTPDGTPAGVMALAAMLGALFGASVTIGLRRWRRTSVVA